MRHTFGIIILCNVLIRKLINCTGLTSGLVYRLINILYSNFNQVLNLQLLTNLHKLLNIVFLSKSTALLTPTFQAYQRFSRQQFLLWISVSVLHLFAHPRIGLKDDLTQNGRRPHTKWKTTSLKMEDDQKGRQPKRKTT